MTDISVTSNKQTEAEALNFSRPLDVHRWSDYPEVNEFVDQIHADYFTGKRHAIERKHLKVVLLDLYVCWLEHPDQKLAVPMSPKAYQARGNRYNSLHISSKTIEVVNRLAEVGLIDGKEGFYDRARRTGMLTRIWPTATLVKLFKASALDANNVGTTADQEVIVLRDVSRALVDYEDNDQTNAMRAIVQEYNALLSRTLIDIRQLDDPWIDLKNGSKLLIGRHRQKVNRVFNRSSFDHGGRFYGPWWQACPKAWRREIFINDAPTIEQDYSSLHIALLYSTKGINYFETYEGDAYQVATPDFLESAVQTRKYAKLLLLMAINSKGDSETFAAFRSNRNESSDPLASSLTNAQLAIILNALREKHPLIADDLATDAGIKLMNLDSKITEHVIRRFTALNIPVLTIHDSYIVNFGNDELLNKVLTEAYEVVTGQTSVKSTIAGVIMDDEATWLTQRLPESAMVRSEGYKGRMIEWLVREDDLSNA